MGCTHDFSPKVRPNRTDSVVGVNNFPCPKPRPAACNKSTSPCVHHQWKSKLCQINSEVLSKKSNLADHLDSIPTLQSKILALKRRCIQACLYPNPRSLSQRKIMEQYNTIASELDMSIKLSRFYKPALKTYMREVQAIQADIRISGTQCGCSKCSIRCASWRVDTHAEVALEAQGVLVRLDRTLDKLQDLRRESKEIGFEELTKVVERVLGIEDVVWSRIVARVFPKQLRRIKEKESGLLYFQ